MIKIDRGFEDPFGTNFLPKFVGKWLEEAKKRKSYLTNELKCAPIGIQNWLMIPGNTERLMRAWLFDYEMTSEVRYFVRIPGMSPDTREQLIKAGFDWVLDRKYAQEVI